jgi:hypothetical protein
LTTIFGYERSTFHWFFLSDSTQAWEPTRFSGNCGTKKKLYSHVLTRAGPCWPRAALVLYSKIGPLS